MNGLSRKRPRESYICMYSKDTSSTLRIPNSLTYYNCSSRRSFSPRSHLDHGLQIVLCEQTTIASADALQLRLHRVQRSLRDEEVSASGNFVRDTQGIDSAVFLVLVTYT